jgi:competence protein ComFC
VGIIDLVFPRVCLECGRAGRYICDDCLRRVDRGLMSDGTVFVWRYEGVVRKAILRLKYNFAFDIASELAERMVVELKKNPFLPREKCFLVPVPLHFARKRWRGFNQSEILGRLISERMGWDFTSDLLVRNLSTQPQVKLGGKERRENVKGAFALNSRCVSTLSTAQSAALSSARATTKAVSFATLNSEWVVFDDVWTTGSTMRECCKVLKEAGVKEVWGLTIAG